jgi:hypothetical protein
MFARLGPAPPAYGADLIARALGVVALASLAMIHLIDLPPTLSTIPLVGIGYLGIIAAAIVVGGVMMARSHRLVWAAAGGLAISAMVGYVLTRTVGGFLGDHGDVGNWRCSLGIAALSVETLLILLATWQARTRAATTAPQPQPTRRAPESTRRAPEYSHLGR